jgi:lysophospholipase L1-like esterase
MTARGRETFARLALVAAAAVATGLAVEAGLRLTGYAPARTAGPGELFGPRARVFLDCYPTNPRGYFRIDLRDAETRRRYEDLGVRDVGTMAARAPHAVEFRYNRLYFRDREFGPREAGVTRVVVLGDSFTEGQGVQESDTAVRRLEGLLNAAGGRRWEVLNCARRGADFPGLYKMFEKALAFDPDLVVHAMVLNDAARSAAFDARQARINDWILDRSRLRAEGTPARPRWFTPRLFDFVGDRVERWRVGRDSTRWYLEMYGEPNRAGWEQTQGYLREMDRQMRARGGAFLVAAWPLLVDLDHDPFRAAEETIAAFCAQAGITRVDLRPALAGHSAQSLWVHPMDHHPNEVAQRLVAEALVAPVRARTEAVGGSAATPSPSPP